MLGKAQPLKGIKVKRVAPNSQNDKKPIAQFTVEPEKPLTIAAPTGPTGPAPLALALAPAPAPAPALAPTSITGPIIFKGKRKVTIAAPAPLPTPAPYNPFNAIPSQPAAPYNPFNAIYKPTTALNVIGQAQQVQAQQAPLPFIQGPITFKGRRTLKFRTYGEKEENYRRQKAEELRENPYKLETPPAFLPQTRLAFNRYMASAFSNFSITETPKPDFEACAKMGQRGEGVIERFLYQQFVREYLRQETPYRGLLVYHGLGSGKTCTAIAAAEALFGKSNKKIIVMTPGSLRTNFQSELTSCGFRHHSLQNHWVFLPDDGNVVAFAKDILGIKTQWFWDEYQKAPTPQRGIWIPDFDKPSNYSTLSAWQQTAIRAQIKVQLEGRIKFLSYNSARDTSKHRLQQIACDDPTFFDNAVIVIDEIHNITRLMCRKMDKEILANARRGMKDPAFDPITADPWKPAICATPLKHSRAYLLYRLLATARNSKIIGLSGTPLINFPEEVAILANLLGGYIHTVEATVPVTLNSEQELAAAARAHPRIDYVNVQKIEFNVKIQYSVLPEKYKKVYDDAGAFKGVEYDPAAIESPLEIHQQLTDVLAQKEIKLSAPTQASYPLLPPTRDEFYRIFINETDLSLANKSILRRRLQGLVSYYRGSKPDLMPAVKEDVLVPVPLTEYSYTNYFNARTQELRTRPKSMAQDLDEMENSANPAYYRFRSRSACNFVFPSDIERPFPVNKKAAEIDTGVDSGDVAMITDSDQIVEDVAEQEVRIAGYTSDELMDLTEEQIETLSDEEAMQIQKYMETGEVPVGAAAAAAATTTTAKVKTYAELLEEARRQLYARRNELLVLTGDVTRGLDKFSPKMAAILRKIEEMDAVAESTNEETGEPNFYGPHLVYSQFISMEGLGILGMAMEANGYVPIELEGDIANPKFSARTLASLEKGPGAKERRFMFFTSNSTRNERDILLNIFNGRFDKLPTNIKTVLERYYSKTRNLRGEIAQIFGLGAAGAEGISLKNVRAVHIMEPYWNSVRTEQVKGRAIRICSHMELPLEQRNVRVYTYCAVFEGKIDATLKFSDNSLTSDQYINEIAKKKSGINKGILDIMKETAVDCQLNLLENQDTTCRVYDVESNEVFAYNPNINDDLKNPPQDVAVGPGAAEAVAGAEAVAAAAAAVPEIKGITNTVKAKTMIAERKALAEGALPKVGVETAPVIALKGKEYIMIAKPGRSDLFTLYDRSDALKSRPLGLLKKDPITGSFAVKMN